MIVTPGFKVFRFFGLAFLSIVVLVPLYVVVTTSLKPLADVQGAFTWIPSNFTIKPYFDIWETVPLAQYFKNSLIVTCSATILSVIMAVLAAYALARLRFKGQRP